MNIDKEQVFLLVMSLSWYIGVGLLLCALLMFFFKTLIKHLDNIQTLSLLNTCTKFASNIIEQGEYDTNNHNNLSNSSYDVSKIQVMF